MMDELEARLRRQALRRPRDRSPTALSRSRADDLEARLRRLPLRPPAHRSPVPSSARRRRRWSLVTAAAASLFVAGGIGWWRSRLASPHPAVDALAPNPVQLIDQRQVAPLPDLPGLRAGPLVSTPRGALRPISIDHRVLLRWQADPDEVVLVSVPVTQRALIHHPIH